MKFLRYLPLLLLFSACVHPSVDSVDKLQPDSTLNIIYAKGFSVDYFTDYKRVQVFDPWHEGQVLATYYLVADSQIVTPDASKTLQIPLKSIAITSCTHIEFLRLCGALGTIFGVCSPELIYNDSLQKAFSEGKIASLGDAFNTNLERLVVLQPNALMLASYNQRDNNSQRLQAAGIPILYNNEWMESSLLARAEWMKFVAVFYDKEAEVCNFFSQVVQSYNEAKMLAQNSLTKPTIMAGGNFKGTWYVPGGQSFMAQLFAHAGGDYFYKNDISTSSLPLNFETVLNNFSQADVWLNAPVASLSELFAMDERHRLFNSAKNGRVFGFFARTKPSGANDFWESAVAHPDVVLRDVIWALQPQLLPNYEPTYLIQLH